MLDEGKEHKLAAARLKLKQYRSKRSKAPDGSSLSNAGSQSSPTVSSRASSCEPTIDVDHQNAMEPNSSTLHNDGNQNVLCQQNNFQSSSPMSSMINSLEANMQPSLALLATSSNNTVNDFFNSSVQYAMADSSLTVSTSVDQTVNMLSNTNLILNASDTSIPNLSPETSKSDAIVSDYSSAQYSASASSSVSFTHCDQERRDSSVDSVKTEVPISEESVSLPQSSTVENLRQISEQLEGLVNEAEDTVAASSGLITVRSVAENNSQSTLIKSLEARNSTLAHQLQEQEIISAQQKQHLSRLTMMLQEAQKKEAEDCGENPVTEELSHVRQQLHMHVQTVGILVAEKTQLESNISDLKHSLRISQEKSIELEGRLTASRQRVNELEESFKSKENELSKVSLENDRLQSLVTLAQEEKERYKLRCTDNELRVAELGERVRSSGKDQQSLQEQLADTKTQLHMANIRIEQLRNSSGDSANILDELNTEKKAHCSTQEQLCEVKQQLAQAEAVKNKEVTQYQLYTQQITAHVEQLKTELAEAERRKQELTECVGQKDQQLQQMQQELLNLKSSASGAEAAQCELQQLRAQVESLRQESSEALESKKQLEQDNLSLSRLSEEQREKIERLELSVDRQQTEAVDSSGLLIKMQSDKVAAARALAQNKILKEQLAELQDGFIMMSNKKLELTEKLEKELHLKKGLHKQLSDVTEQEAKLRETSTLREKEVEQLRESCSSLASQLAALKQQSQQHFNGVQHDENTAQESSNECVVGEPACVENRTVTDNEVQQQGDTKTAVTTGLDSSSVSTGADTSSVSTGADTSSVSTATDTSSVSTGTDTSSGSTGPNEMPASRDVLLEYRLAQLSSTHSALVSRFNRAMAQVAQLNEEKQQLEVTVEQLQLENDTIGDYITIYQFKRGVLSQQMREKDLELDRLRGDRQSLIEKLSKLQELVLALSHERGGGAVHGATDLLSGVNSLIASAASSSDGGVQNGSLTNGAVGSPADEDSATEHEACSHGHYIKDDSKPAESKTVSRIMELIKEMGEQPASDTRPIQPCGLCSGSLITV